jgi:hypothetical protein
MNKNSKSRLCQERATQVHLRFDENIENFKRRRALPAPAFGSFGREALFFDRMLNIRRIKDFVFITKAEARAR